MADEKHTFETARVRLEEIASEVRKKDTSLEKSLDLLEEGVRLANICTELVDHTDMSAGALPADVVVGIDGETDQEPAGPGLADRPDEDPGSGQDEPPIQGAGEDAPDDDRDGTASDVLAE